MGHLPKLIEDFALILMAGALITLLFKRIKQPWLERKYNRGPLLIIEMTRTLLGLFFLIFWVQRRDTLLMPFDQLGIIATDNQVKTKQWK